MTVPIVAVFNNQSAFGNTSMVHNLSYLFAYRGLKVLTADLDPQAHLTAAFVEEERLEELMADSRNPLTIFGAILPLKNGTGDISEVHIEPIDDYLWLIPGDMALATFEDKLSEAWPKCLTGDEGAFRVISAFWRLMQQAAEKCQADVIMLDIGPNFGAINRAALIASDFVVTLLCADFISIQGLENLGPVLRDWRSDWQDRVSRKPLIELPLPAGNITPLGYVAILHPLRLDLPVTAARRWVTRIPGSYQQYVLNEKVDNSLTITSDPNCITITNGFRNLMQLAQEARKPMIFLKPADGALGAYQPAVTAVYKDFHEIAKKIAEKAGLKT